MARTTLTASTVDITTGVNITAGQGTAGTADGHDVILYPDLFLVIENTSGAATRDVTLVGQSLAGGESITNVTVTIPISSQTILGAGTASAFRTSDKIQINFDSGNESDMKALALRCPHWL